MNHPARQTLLATQIALALAAWAAMPASAQTAAAPGPRTAAEDSGEIQTITVTANRRVEDKQKSASR